jgi:hypothetical protein
MDMQASSVEIEEGSDNINRAALSIAHCHRIGRILKLRVWQDRKLPLTKTV